MNIEISSVTSHLRIFLDETKTTKNKDPYDAILTVQHLNDNEVYLSGLKGHMNKSMYVAIRNYFTSRGFTKVSFERHKKVVDKTPE